MTSNQPWWLTMPVAEVAATILPYFSSRSHVSERLAMKEITSWWRTGSYPPSSLFGETERPLEEFENPDYRAVAEAMQVLEHAGLLMRSVSRVSLAYFAVGLTRLGMHALQANTVRQHLGLSGTPPTS